VPRNQSGVAGSVDAPFGKVLIHPEAFLKVAVHDITEGFAVSVRHVADVLFQPVKEGLHIHLGRQRLHLFIGIEGIPAIFVPAKVEKNPFEDFPVVTPPEEFAAHLTKERSGSMTFHTFLG
jgi:hypothetical protein